MRCTALCSKKKLSSGFPGAQAQAQGETRGRCQNVRILGEVNMPRGGGACIPAIRPAPQPLHPLISFNLVGQKCNPLEPAPPC